MGFPLFDCEALVSLLDRQRTCPRPHAAHGLGKRPPSAPGQWRGLLTGLLALAACGFVGHCGAVAAGPKVLLIGIDGCRPDALAAADAPHLDALAADGVYCRDTRIVAPRATGADTVSGPGWSSILTGVWADKHGVCDNEFAGANYVDYPHFFRRLKQARPEAVTISIVSWEPIHGRIVSAADASCATVTGDDEDYVRGDAEVARLAVEALGRHDPDAMFVYFGNVDVAGHNHGFHPSVPQYTDAIHAVDGHVGAVIAALRARPSHADEDWLVLVCTDHGGQGTRHGDGAGVPEIYNTFLIASGPSAPRGAIDAPTALVDVVPTALAHLGVAVDPAWGLDGRDVRTLAGP